MVFTLHQLQEKCREQRNPMFIAFFDLTKAFDIVGRKSPYKVLEKIQSTFSFTVGHFFSHQSHSRWGVALIRVVSWRPFSLTFILLSSWNMFLMGENGSLFNLKRLKSKQLTKANVYENVLFCIIWTVLVQSDFRFLQRFSFWGKWTLHSKRTDCLHNRFSI